MTQRPGDATAAAIFRNDDIFTQMLRQEAILDIEDIARLNRAVSPTHSAISSLGPPSTAVFSGHDESTITKPTSTGSPYPEQAHTGKGKAKACDASSLSVAHGSESEAEAQHSAERRDDLLAMGGWSAGHLTSTELLKGAARAKKRNRHDRSLKRKKPQVTIFQHDLPRLPRDDGERDSVVTIAPAGDGPGMASASCIIKFERANTFTEKTHLRKRVMQQDEDLLSLAEEGQILPTSKHSTAPMLLSPIRLYMFVGSVALIALTIGLSVVGVLQTGKTRLACTKGIIFAATVVVAILTVLAMITVRRAPQEALLAGLLEIVIGFMLLAQLDNFI